MLRILFLAEAEKSRFSMNIEPQNIKKRYDELVFELLYRDENYLRRYVDELPEYEEINRCGYVDKKKSLKCLMKCKRCRECMVNAMCKLSGF